LHDGSADFCHAALAALASRLEQRDQSPAERIGLVPDPPLREGFARNIVTLILKRSSLVAQVADAIRIEILGKAWTEWLPSERELSHSLHVSRNTCRHALRILRRETLVKPVLGQGIRINRSAVKKARLASAHSHSVGIILPEAIGRLRPRISLLVDNLRHELFDSGVRVELHNSPNYYQRNPQHALEKLVENSRHDAWIPILSNEPFQRWFMKRRIPCVVIGSVYPGIGLPSVDMDNRAVGRHAAGRLIALGHRRLVFFNRRSPAAGDIACEEGFTEGVRSSPHAGIASQVVYHSDSRENIAHLVDHLFATPTHPTGLLIANSYCYLSVASALAGRGFKIPGDVSLICRDDDQFLSYLDPEPARYQEDLAVVARKIMLLLRPMLEGGDVRADPVRIFPRFTSGGSCQSA